ncbi:uncharacterized protein LOC132270929 isoform X2 [Cornus florida]|uniref:uncharacterized protein LOC132270929 isoform X2 n=1 Tax=Cornus florida TaxID=4283 RepID=UPI0028A1C594|nr:uncharacterized protein LOC132270929 isoform X2 [Cornus florida]
MEKSVLAFSAQDFTPTISMEKKGKTAKLIVPAEAVKESSSVPQHQQTVAQLQPWFNPWKITLAGVLVIMGNSLILHSAEVTTVVLFLICASWYHFICNSNSSTGSDLCPERFNPWILTLAGVLVIMGNRLILHSAKLPAVVLFLICVSWYHSNCNSNSNSDIGSDLCPKRFNPWIITLAGILVIMGNRLTLHSTEVTAVVLFLICASWYHFICNSNSSIGSDLCPERFNPWIITLAGVLVIMGNRLILHSAAVTAVVLFLICASWYHFIGNSNSNIGSDLCPERFNPWITTLAGVLVIMGNRLILHSAEVTAVVLFLICVSWYRFICNSNSSIESDLCSERFNPWMITLAGVLVIMGNMLILHSTTVTAAVLYLICAWWYHLICNSNSNSSIGSDLCREREGQYTETSHSSKEHDYDLKEYKKRFTCDGCKEEGYGPRYRCTNSDYELHEECHTKSSELKISHEFLKESSTLKFYEKQKQPRCCIACGRDICGYVYSDEVKGCNFHPCCTKLKPEFTNNEVIFRLCPKASSKCMWCIKKGQKTRVSGWSYISACKKYRFHVYCVPEMMHEAWKKGYSMTLEKMDLSLLDARRSNRDGDPNFFKETVKIVGMLIGAAVDPSGITAGLVPIAVELLSGVNFRKKKKKLLSGVVPIGVDYFSNIFTSWIGFLK